MSRARIMAYVGVSTFYVLYNFCCASLSAAEPGSFYTAGPGTRKVVALTFDDGPGPYTEQVLEILKQHNVKATFFMEGSQVEMRPDIARKVAEGGHEVGNHTYSHPNYYLNVKGDKETMLRDEIRKTHELIKQAAAIPPTIMRMPHGYVRSWVKEVAKKENYVLVNWTFGCDWKKMDAAALEDAYIKNIHSGAIFLMHDGGKNRKAAVAALPKIIEGIKARGYAIETAGALIDSIAKDVAVSAQQPVKH